MSKEHLKIAAMNLFATHGYEAASMQLVAEAVGIKKQSIYTHFRNKDELFLAACEQAMNEELAYTLAQVEKMETIDALYAYLHHTAERYEARIETRFWLRMSIYPPQHLEKRVMVYVYYYLDSIEQAVKELLIRQRETLTTDISSTHIAQAYLSIMDACHIEMLYGGPVRVKQRIEASWQIFKRGVAR
ncbi:TetR/AcrR family transcriptional regulator [Caryophanon latum]|uniref:HTH tetR-type domain-containing protein n=1 Tax=Caryophanon latum TaxID=33977 RepID=A0A1C0YTI0_9BACL|nr:TetR/AcrR family transcriptional regulator [Caryophanon latum]OCS90488.1 hypothetical protein A6K76_11525 [Caryophanon latum]